MIGISKAFGAVQALDSVNLSVEAGTIHAIVGENGAGKTTLMNVLFGAYRPDSGEIRVQGREATFGSAGAASKAGIGMVSQHYGVIPALTCLENLVLGDERGQILDRRALKAKAQEIAGSMGFSFDWDEEASSLSPAGAQKLEILKLLWRDSRIMILDEPTAMLGPSDADSLFASMVSLVERGATVILVTHRLPEVMSYCKRATVMRGGGVVADVAVAETTSRELAQLIVGPNKHIMVDERVPTTSAGDPVLEMSHVTVRSGHEVPRLSDINLIVRAGEVVGVAGVDGNGQRELIEAIAGIEHSVSGSIRFRGADLGKSATRDRLDSGISVIPENRHEEGVIESWSVEDNAALGVERVKPLSNGHWIDAKAKTTFAQAAANRFHTRHGGLRLPLASLSGGNQQRLIAGRALALNPKLLVAFQPARGLDLGGTADVYGAIRTQCREGMAALIVSFDLDELLEHCDRIVVLNHGVLAEPASAHSHDRQEIGRLMVAG